MTCPDVSLYICRVAAGLRRELGDDLLAVYVGGSIALGGYVPGRSDVDLLAVCRDGLLSARRAATASALRHESLPSPGRGLDLVVYSERAVGEPSSERGYELELLTGCDRPSDATLRQPEPVSAHRRLIDRAIVARHGVTVIGPQASALVADIPRSHVLSALAASLRRQAHAAERHAILDACRALRYTIEGRWCSRDGAARWALDYADDGQLILEALRADGTAARLEPGRVDAFLARVREELERC